MWYISAIHIIYILPIRILKWQGTKRSPFIHAFLYQPFPRIEWSQWALSCQLTLCGILAGLVCPSERPIEQDRNPESNIGIWFDLTSNLNLKSSLLHLMYTFFAWAGTRFFNTLSKHHYIVEFQVTFYLSFHKIFQMMCIISSKYYAYKSNSWTFDDMLL